MRTVYAAANDGFKTGLGGTPIFWANRSHIRGGTAELTCGVDDFSYLGYAVGYGHWGYPVHGGRSRVPQDTALIADVDWHMTEQKPETNNIPPRTVSTWYEAIKLTKRSTILTGYHVPLQPLNDHWDWSFEQVLEWQNANGRASCNKWLDIFPI